MYKNNLPPSPETIGVLYYHESGPPLGLHLPEVQALDKGTALRLPSGVTWFVRSGALYLGVKSKPILNQLVLERPLERNLYPGFPDPFPNPLASLGQPFVVDSSFLRFQLELVTLQPEIFSVRIKARRTFRNPSISLRALPVFSGMGMYFCV
ncbi:hypothetical protein D9619_011505 [Psilocybe cf. subviscida]|uniref:Uncharacterized protein n=1 Tax=Psilocybe cf. subviscida TaxID=2480587 RepID=A0A8H5BT98_9AGAR|nr:hypothetical protein D9619_011505 [Psilocybe cf. subviscida]